MTPVEPGRRRGRLARGTAPVLVVTLLLAPSCRTAAVPPARNLILVTLDTTRDDRLGCYGRSNAGTPWLDALAARGLLFRRAYTPVPLTLPAHISIFTGMYPTHTGVHVNGQTQLAHGVTTLAERLARAGFYTAAAVGGYPVTGRFPVRRGFEAYDDTLADPNNPEGLERDAGAVVRAALAELPSRNGRRLFLWVHLYDPHDPYAPPSPFRERFPKDPYQGEIARVDAALAELAEGLQRDLSGESMLFCVVGDHGESLGEHGEPTHGFFAYDATVHVPLILAGPRVPRGAIRTDPVSTVDIVPTILGLLGLPAVKGLDGFPLDVAAPRASNGRDLYFETELPRRNYGWSALHGVIEGRYKLIAAPRPELYDLERDPHESMNLYDDRPQVAAKLDAWLRASMGNAAGDGEEAAPVDPRLRSLGYVGSGARPRGRDDALADPKDKLSLYLRFTGASRQLERGNARAALAELDPLVGEEDTPGARFERAVALRMLGRLDDALADLDRVTSDDPSYPGVHLERARIAAARADWSTTLRESRMALAEDPASPEALLFRGAGREASGDVSGAEADYRRALTVNPAYGQASLRLAALLVRAGRIDDARTVLRAHLRLHPNDELARGLLGSI